MDQAELHSGLGKHGLNGIREALQAVHAGDKDVLNATVSKFGDNLQPELGAFSLGHPQAQNLLDAVQIDANGQVQGLDPHSAVIAHLDVNAVHVNDGVQRIEWA